MNDPDNLKDLEQLLEDLGRPKSVAPTKKTRSSVVNLSELEALMTDLADTPTPPPSHSSKPSGRSSVSVSASFSAPAARPASTRSAVVSTSFDVDDLDSLMNSLNGDSSSHGHSNGHHDNGHNHDYHDHHNDHHHQDHHHHQDVDDYLDDYESNHHAPSNNHHHVEPAVHVAVQPPKAAHPPPAPLSKETTSTIDELEELLYGLEDNSARNSVRASVVAKPPAISTHNAHHNNNNHNNNSSFNLNLNHGNSNMNRLSVAAAAHAPSSSLNLASGSGTFGVNARVNAPPPAAHAHQQQQHNNYNVAPAHHNNSNSSLSFGGGGSSIRPSVNNNYNNNSYNQPPGVKPFVANPAGNRPANNSNALDALLGDLQNQLLSVPDPSSPAVNGSCFACGRSILGEVITASGNRYHPEHFVCGNCQTPLGTSNFYEQDGVHHCERCYQELMCPRCGHCDEPILDRCVTAMGKKWHLEHFVCTQCSNPFKNGSFFEREGRAFCEPCFANAFAPRCGGCQQPVNGPTINACGQAWHPEHFVCQYCQKAFTGSFYELAGKPYCDLHYHQQTGSLCAGCNKAVAGKCIDALGKKWHPEHFVCAFCMNMLAAGSFTENSGKAYCKDCHGKLFG